ncbi:hypothetical protein C8R46DRAFT_1026873 [Mycena filopes]|nr:hypothetical protein C8R46DRAFT_1026873 [Mycena filopes]
MCSTFRLHLGASCRPNGGVGLDGLIALSFSGVSPSNLAATWKKNGSDPDLAQPFLYNIFAQTPQQDNFIGISLSRSDDLEGSADASFTINEVDQAYADVVNAPVLPLFHLGMPRWNILVDAIDVDGVNVTMPPSVAGAPHGKLVAQMDTGTPTGILPTDLIASIYSAIPGSVEDMGDILCKKFFCAGWIFEQQWRQLELLQDATSNFATFEACNYSVK